LEQLRLAAAAVVLMAVKMLAAMAVPAAVQAAQVQYSAVEQEHRDKEITGEATILLHLTLLAVVVALVL
jgi:hypothetical protein